MLFRSVSQSRYKIEKVKIDNYEYEVNELGEIFRIGNTTPKYQSVNRDGYKVVGLWKDNKSTAKTVHRLVALAFIPNPENKPQVNHKNKIKSDNRVENLEWTTCSENHKHAYKNGRTRQKGELAAGAKLTELEAKEIKYNYPNLSSRKIASKYNISFTTVQSIKKGKMWNHI